MEAPSDPRSADVDVDIYLKVAYPSGNLPEPVRRRVTWDEGPPPRDLFMKPPFERAGRAPGGNSPIFALRLGNRRYPHMKLQFQPWDNPQGLMLSVNTHDQIAGLDLGGADVEGFKRLQIENQQLKEEIEQAWEAEGLPTFLHFLRTYIQDRAEGEGEGETPQGS